MGTTIDHQEAKGSPVSGAAQSGQISELLKPALLQIRQLTLKIPSTSQQNSAAVEWKLYYLNSYRSIFLSSESEDEIGQTVTQVITPYLNAGTRDFRLQLNIKSVPFLVGIFPADHKIFFCTPRLGSELFTLQEGGEFSHSPDYLELASLVERISALDMSAVPPSIEILTQKYQLADLLHDPAYQEIERENRLLTDKLLVEMNRYRPTLFERVTDWGLNLTAHYALIRVHLLKFLAILPSLDFDSGVEVKRILMESLHRLFTDSKLAAKLRRKGQGRSLPTSLIWMLRTLFYFSLIIPAIPLAFLVRTSVRWMARRFIAGETIERADRALTKLFLSGRDVTLDQLGELVVSEQEADHYCNEVIKLIKGFSLHVPRGQKNGAGINRANVSIKVSALSSDFKPQAFDYTYNSVAPRLSKILLAAKEEEVFLNIDAEHYDYRDVVLDIYSKVLLTTDQLKDFQQTGIVLQAYLRDAYGHYQKIVALAKQRGIMMPIRIVKGAYWDAETIEAEAHSFDAPEFLNKEETDLHFRQLTIAIFKDHPHVQLVIASHNFSDHTFVEVVRGRHYPSLPEIEHQCLHMTYEALSTGMQKMGWVVRNYLPVGSLLVGMAYLVRRIMENSSQVGVLMMMRSHKRGLASRSPQEMFLERVEQRKVEVDFSASKLTSHFFNLTPVRLYLEDDRFHFNYVLKQFQNHHLGKSYENSFKIDGDWHEVVSSSDPSILVGKIRFALTADALRAVELAESSYNSGKWAQLSPYARASFLVAAANIMSAKRNELASLICYEAGKAIPEALADIDEAVDFMNFYAREEVKIHKKMPNLISRGVILVVAPWNFPLAIPCGMTVSSLVAGNSIVLKSAKHTPLIAQSMIDILHQAGVPKDVLIHLPGKGSEIGDDLTADPRLAGVVFTGSKEVGMRIAHQVGKRVVHNKLYDRYYPTKVITEMGGKNG
ncbi:MAG: aldehyde dehydrogenase family protein, partial [Bdellovibrionales bacterium]|nr:aldehyde dehydrogenase family protein [Bdellovibrionales bacterium]